jgi:hypothetical protein
LNQIAPKRQAATQGTVNKTWRYNRKLWIAKTMKAAYPWGK